jgi:hypothetical protein
MEQPEFGIAMIVLVTFVCMNVEAWRRRRRARS